MANKKNWLGILVITLVFGMTVVGCGGDYTPSATYDNYAHLTVTNTSSIDYYISHERRDDGSLKGSYTLKPSGRVGFTPRWNDGESSNFTLYYTSERSSKNPLSRTYYSFSDQETREVTIP